MNLKEQENIAKLKLQKYSEQGGLCAGCMQPFQNGDKMELAHILPQRKWIIEKYGKEIIHHPDNMKLTHPGNCNAAVQMSPNKTELVNQHVENIRRKLIK